MEPYTNVNFEFYTKELKRNVIGNAEDFERLAIPEKLRMQELVDLGLVQEKYKNGIDSVVCFWIEEAYKAEQMETGEAGFVDSSESIGAYSHSGNSAAHDAFVQKNTKSTEQKRREWLKLFCYIKDGIL